MGVALGSGKATRGTPMVRKGNPRSIFGTLGWVKARGGCNIKEGRTKRGPREG
jgi:hypothetical protein